MYNLKEGELGARQYYRFSRPGRTEFPAMIELFSHVPNSLKFPPNGHLTPIPLGNDISSLSAILLDEAYYTFMQHGKIEVNGLPLVGPEYLIALKAKAWLDLSARRVSGEVIDGNTIHKHKRDVFRLFQIVDPDFIHEPNESIQVDMRQFLSAMLSESIDLKSIGIRETKLKDIIDNLSKMFRL